MTGKYDLLVITGHTASGKTALAAEVAEKLNGEIISADSRQVYKYLNIGTGKDLDEYTINGKKTNHYLIDICEPNEQFYLHDFVRELKLAFDKITSANKLPIICGGTGFWIQAIVDNINFPEVKPDWKLRNKLEKYSAEKLFTMLKKLDLHRAKNIDVKNKVRLIRAIEICKSIKKVPKILNTKYQILNTKYEFLQIGVTLSKEKLYQNIEKRLKARFKQGMIAEVKKLHAKSLSWKKIQSFGLGYYWIPLYLQGKLNKSELFEKIFQAEKDYAKRQMTWFKRDKRIKWINSPNKLIKYIEQSI